MRLAILGTRGIPNLYGGFEQFAQYLSDGLTQKGHEVYVYNSHTHPFQKKKNGVELTLFIVLIPKIKLELLDNLSRLKLYSRLS